jgi:hypothetical protein
MFDVLVRVTTPSLIEFTLFVCARTFTPKNAETNESRVSDRFRGYVKGE